MTLFWREGEIHRWDLRLYYFHMLWGKKETKYIKNDQTILLGKSGYLSSAQKIKLVIPTLLIK